MSDFNEKLYDALRGQAILTEKEQINIAHRSILVVKVNSLCNVTGHDREHLRDDILRQMEDGVVVLSHDCDVYTVDADRVVVS